MSTEHTIQLKRIGHKNDLLFVKKKNVFANKTRKKIQCRSQKSIHYFIYNLYEICIAQL